MNWGKVLAIALCAWLGGVLLATLYMDGITTGNIVKASFIVAGAATATISVVYAHKWPALIGLGVLCVAGSLSIQIDDLTNAYLMLAVLGLFIVPAVALTLTLLSMRHVSINPVPISPISINPVSNSPSNMPGLADIFKIDSGEETRHYIALGVAAGIIALLVAGMAILWNVPAIRFYLSGQSYVFIQVLLFCCISLLLTAPLLGSFGVKRRG